MKNFKKDITFKTMISMVAVVFIVTSMAYSAPMSDCLRVPSSFQNEKYRERLKDGLRTEQKISAAKNKIAPFIRRARGFVKSFFPEKNKAADIAAAICNAKSNKAVARRARAFFRIMNNDSEEITDALVSLITYTNNSMGLERPTHNANLALKIYLEDNPYVEFTDTQVVKLLKTLNKRDFGFYTSVNGDIPALLGMALAPSQMEMLSAAIEHEEWPNVERLLEQAWDAALKNQIKRENRKKGIARNYIESLIAVDNDKQLIRRVRALSKNMQLSADIERIINELIDKIASLNNSVGIANHNANFALQMFLDINPSATLTDSQVVKLLSILKDKDDNGLNHANLDIPVILGMACTLNQMNMLLKAINEEERQDVKTALKTSMRSVLERHLAGVELANVEILSMQQLGSGIRLLGAAI